MRVRVGTVLGLIIRSTEEGSVVRVALKRDMVSSRLWDFSASVGMHKQPPAANVEKESIMLTAQPNEGKRKLRTSDVKSKALPTATAMVLRLAWLWTTPFGSPVLPEVKMAMAGA
jgi:hypothetical protein